ncbi:MAG: hypothetical protein ACI9UH_000655, partial [Gammaproteobacteria bacterium]
VPVQFLLMFEAKVLLANRIFLVHSFDFAHGKLICFFEKKRYSILTQVLWYTIILSKHYPIKTLIVQDQ